MMRHPRHSPFLRFIISYKTVMGFTELVIAVSFFNLFGRNIEEALTGFVQSLHFDTDNRFIGYVIKQAATIGNDTLIGITIILFIFGVMNLVEAWGLHKRQLWGEWLTVVATSLLIPFEIYEVYLGVTAFKVFILVMNIIIVYYLAKHKELFKKKEHRRPTH
jgi:uncharacterized membrane protein (DUF2068 family)